MNALHPIHRLHQHRAWVNEKLLNAAAGLPEEKLKTPLAIGQGSLWRSLMHMYAAEWVWLAAVQGEEAAVLPGDLPNQLPGNQQGAGGIESLAELTLAWLQLEARWREYLSQLSLEVLEERIHRRRASGERVSTSRLDALLHVCTHAHYTAAQTINMLRQLGVTPLPDPMLISLARAELAAES